jgi:hypothetical protein
MATPRAENHSRAAEIAEWAWVELNYRPHAYQAPKASAHQRISKALATAYRTGGRAYPRAFWAGVIHAVFTQAAYQ